MASNYASRVPTAVLRSHVTLGIMQITVGCLLVLLTIIGLSTKQDYFSVASGFWAGPFIIVAGICGLHAGRGSCGTLGCVVSCLVFSIIASALAFPGLVLDSIMASSNIYAFNYRSSSARGSESLLRTTYATNILSALLFAFEFVLAIVHSVYACRASCCCVPAAPPMQPGSPYLVTQVITVGSPPQHQQQQPPYYPYPTQQPQAQPPYHPYPAQQPQAQPPYHPYPAQQPAFNPSYPPPHSAPEQPPSYDQIMRETAARPAAASAPPKE